MTYQGHYEVIVGKLGRVVDGDDAFKANNVYAYYVRMSERGEGGLGGQPVALFRNGEVVKEHKGDSSDQV